MVFSQNLAIFDQIKIPTLNRLLERPYKELLNACFSFEIKHSKLKLYAFKVLH